MKNNDLDVENKAVNCIFFKKGNVGPEDLVSGPCMSSF